MELDDWKRLICGKSHDLDVLLEHVTKRVCKDYAAKALGQWIDKDGHARTAVYTLPSVVYHRKFERTGNGLDVEFIARTGLVRVLIHGTVVETFGTRF